MQGSGNQLNGVSTDGIPGAKPGTYFRFPYLKAAPRVGMAWNVTGDGKTAIRASAGIFYNFPRSTGTGGYSFAGGCPVSCTNQIRWATFDDVAAAAAGGGPALVQSPVNVNVGGYNQPLAKSYNANVAFQRDIGFNTVAEIAYVGNFQFEAGRTVDVNRLPLNVYGNPANLVNNAAITANSLRPVYAKYPGMGSCDPVLPGPLHRVAGLPCDAAQRRSPAVERGCRWASSTRWPRATATSGAVLSAFFLMRGIFLDSKHWDEVPDSRGY